MIRLGKKIYFCFITWFICARIVNRESSSFYREKSVDFILDRQEQREKIEIKVDDNRKVTQYIYYDGEDVNGTVRFIEIDSSIWQISILGTN